MSSREDRIDAVVAIYWALSILLFPLSWIVAMGMAALIHELGHYLALRCCGKKVRKFKIGITGALLETSDLTPCQELMCALAGPLAGLLPLFAMRWIPKVAFCALVQSIFNLLPIYPLDGGRCLGCAARLIGIPEKCSRILGYLFLCAFGVFAIYAMVVLRLGMVPLLAAVILFIKAIGKRPCKRVTHWI